MKVFLSLCFLCCASMVYSQPPNSIYFGKNFLWKVYYDAGKIDTVIEISGVKYGNHDFLLKSKANGTDVIASSDIGQLIRKNGELYYANKDLAFELKLEKKKYTSKIDDARKKLFEIMAFQKTSSLKDSLNVDYQFDWNVSTDFNYFRDNRSLPKEYVPDYLKSFYKSLDQQ